MNFQTELEAIKNIRQAKYSEINKLRKKEIVYDYDKRKNILDYIKKCSKSEMIKERMDKNEKQDYKNKISKISLEDLDHFYELDFNVNFMIDLYKFNFNQNVLEKAYLKLSTYSHPCPHITMIKELITKPKLSEDFLLKLVSDYVQINKNYINLIITTGLLETQYLNTINYLMELLYLDQTITVTYEQLKLIYSKTTMTPDKLKFLILRCSNISGFSKCSKTYVDKPNIDLIKILIHEIELKHKCKIDIDLYNL